MAFENFPEVWAALGRLYDSIVVMQRQQQTTSAETSARFDAVAQRFDAMTDRMDAMTDRMDRMVSTVATLAGTVGQLATMVEGHERRLQRLEGQ